jgi:acetoin:2,6-dichlorophenolindophenol oxidoreductase subunit alpha
MSSELAEPGLLDYAQRAPRRPAPLDPAVDQLEIPLETRVSMYETQHVLRQMEKRAHDLFLQNLVKGTSHLSLGM